jgi:hypothetical protein
MSSARLDRVALVVSDLDAVAADLKRIFDIELTTLDVDNLGLKAGLGNDGIELVEKTAPTSPLEKFWRPPLAALAIRCDDLNESVARMEAAGYVVDHRITTPGGVREVSFGDAFHGLPITLYEARGADLVQGVTGDGGGVPYAPSVQWS